MPARRAREVGAQMTMPLIETTALAISVGERLLEMAIELLGASAVQAKLDAQYAAVDAAADLREAAKFEPVTTPATPDALKKGP